MCDEGKRLLRNANEAEMELSEVLETFTPECECWRNSSAYETTREAARLARELLDAACQAFEDHLHEHRCCAAEGDFGLFDPDCGRGQTNFAQMI